MHTFEQTEKLVMEKISWFRKWTDFYQEFLDRYLRQMFRLLKWDN